MLELMTVPGYNLSVSSAAMCRALYNPTTKGIGLLKIQGKMHRIDKGRIKAMAKAEK